MLPFAAEFTAMERAVLNAICEAYADDRTVLEAQLTTAKFSSRQNTGAGFFTNFDVNRDPNLAVGGEKVRNGPQAKVTGLTQGMGFILWFEHGYAHSLEGYTYGDSSVGVDLEKISFELKL